MIIHTTEEGMNCGRSYIYCSERQDALDWEAAIDRAVLEAKDRELHESLTRKYGNSRLGMQRAYVKMFYESLKFEYVVKAVILFAFLGEYSNSPICPFQSKCECA